MDNMQRYGSMHSSKVRVVFFCPPRRTDALVKDMSQIHFVNCERFGSEGVESKLFELSDGGSVALPSSYTPTTHRNGGVTIICEDRRLQPLPHAQLAASTGAIPTYVALFQVFSQHSH
jgi:hypothetical protein